MPTPLACAALKARIRMARCHMNAAIAGSPRTREHVEAAQVHIDAVLARLPAEAEQAIEDGRTIADRLAFVLGKVPVLALPVGA